MGEDLSIKVETLSKILNPAIDMWVSGHEVYEMAIDAMQDWERKDFVESVINRIKTNEAKAHDNMR